MVQRNTTGPSLTVQREPSGTACMDLMLFVIILVIPHALIVRIHISVECIRGLEYFIKNVFVYTAPSDTARSCHGHVYLSNYNAFTKSSYG